MKTIIKKIDMENVIELDDANRIPISHLDARKVEQYLRLFNDLWKTPKIEQAIGRVRRCTPTRHIDFVVHPVVMQRYSIDYRMLDLQYVLGTHFRFDRDVVEEEQNAIVEHDEPHCLTMNGILHLFDGLLNDDRIIVIIREGDFLMNYVKHHVICEIPTDDLCPICLENYKPDDCCVKTCACNHVFHQQCLDTWISQSDFCPSCMQKMAKN